TLLAHVADEVNGAVGLDVRSLIRPSDREHDGQATAVIPDARPGESCAAALDGDVGALGKDGVEMPRDHDGWTLTRSRTLGDDVSDGVDPSGEAERLHTRSKLEPAFGLLEWRRGDLAERNLLLERPRAVCADGVHGRTQASVVGWKLEA